MVFLKHLIITQLVLSFTTTMMAEYNHNYVAEAAYTMPREDEKHEGTWLQWPHDYGWDPNHVRRYEKSWIELTKALHTGERVHIITYNRREKRRVKKVLINAGVDMNQIDLYRYPTDDVWIRDNGPIFVFDDNDELMVEDWKFNGWGGKADWWYDDYIPIDVANELDLDLISVNMVNEGGSIEVDGRGTLMAKKSSILNRNRNRRMTQTEAEEIFERYLGVTNFIWLDGLTEEQGGDFTDGHIDGTARFANGNQIVTHQRSGFVTPSEYDVLKNARDVNGNPYEVIELPLTKNIVPAVNDYGIYVNYYVGNEVVIVPSFNDPNDDVAVAILQQVYPDKTMKKIDFTELYEDGGLVHCVTQQQPVMRK